MRPQTAKEQQDLLDKDPHYQAMMAHKRQMWEEQASILRENEKPLVEALTDAGWPANIEQHGQFRSVWNLVNTAEPYPHLLEPLAKHLRMPYHKRVREGIVRALAVREARKTPIPRIVVDQLKFEIDPCDGPNSLRWVMVNTLMFIGDRSLVSDIEEMIQNPQFLLVKIDLERLLAKLNRRRHKNK